MRYRWFLIAAGSVLILLLAYLLREVVNEKIVIPFSYLWWRLGLYYHAIEEETWLVLTVGMISILAYVGVAGEVSSSDKSDGHAKNPVQGPVEELISWLAKSHHRAYYRWRIANRLSRLARSLLQQRDGKSNWNVSSWDAPEDVKTYLRYGERRSSGGKESSLAQRSNARSERANPIKVVEYLESEIGEHFDANK